MDVGFKNAKHGGFHIPSTSCLVIFHIGLEEMLILVMRLENYILVLFICVGFFMEQSWITPLTLFDDFTYSRTILVEDFKIYFFRFLMGDAGAGSSLLIFFILTPSQYGPKAHPGKVVNFIFKKDIFSLL